MADQDERSYRTRAAAPYSSLPNGELYYKKTHREAVGGSQLTLSAVVASGRPLGVRNCVCLTIGNMHHQPSLCIAEVDCVTERHRLPATLLPI